MIITPMKKTKSRERISTEVKELKAILKETQETLEAIRGGKVDAVVASGKSGKQIYTRKGADLPYRLVIEAVSEGVAIINVKGDIDYCNKSLSLLLKVPLDSLIGLPLKKFIVAEDREKYERIRLKALNKRVIGKFHIISRNKRIPVQISFNPVALDPKRTGIIISDLSGILDPIFDFLKGFRLLARGEPFLQDV